MNPFQTSRFIKASCSQVFNAFQPDRLVRWWGPANFTNTFNVCQFKNGGKWSYVMHGPNGKDYVNESGFLEIIPETKVVIRHTSLPMYTLTVTMAADKDGTMVSWTQVFDNAKVANSISHIVIPANEETWIV